MSDKEKLKKQILSINDWRHPFKLDDGMTVKNTDAFRREWLHSFQHFKWDIISTVLNTFIPHMTDFPRKDLTFADIGCNDGYFTIETLKTGFKSGVGVELREDSAARANLMKAYYGLADLEFRVQNIETMVAQKEVFDITLFLGLLYHITSPVKVLMDMSALTRRFMVILTFISTDDSSSLRLIREDRLLPGSGAVDLVTRPSEKAVVDMLDFTGFNEIVRYYPYPFFNFAGGDDAGINVREWAVYVALKSDETHNVGSILTSPGKYWDKHAKQSQWVILKSRDNAFHCLNKPETRFKAKLRKKLNKLLSD